MQQKLCHPRTLCTFAALFFNPSTLGTSLAAGSFVSPLAWLQSVASFYRTCFFPNSVLTLFAQPSEALHLGDETTGKDTAELLVNVCVASEESKRGKSFILSRRVLGSRPLTCITRRQARDFK